MAEHLLIQALPLALCLLLAMLVSPRRDRARPPRSLASVGWH